MKKLLLSVILLSITGLAQAQMCITLRSQTACQAAGGCLWDGIMCNDKPTLAEATAHCNFQLPNGQYAYTRFGSLNKCIAVLMGGQVPTQYSCSMIDSLPACQAQGCKWVGAAWTGKCTMSGNSITI